MTNQRIITETKYKPNQCPTKHAKAFKPTFGKGKLFCPDCGNNIEIKKKLGALR